MKYFNNQQEYSAFAYRRELRTEANKTGALLLLFFGIWQGLVWSVSNIMEATGTDGIYSESTTMQLLLNGASSMTVFFLIGSVYCLLRQLKPAQLFPFTRAGGQATVMLCVVGLAFSLMSNTASQMVTEVFSLFGITNRGGEIVSSSFPPSIPVYYLTVAVLPALSEEFAFRGIVMGSLRKYSDGLAIVVSSAAFALMHGNFVQLPFTFCSGLVFGFIALKANSLLPAIIIHFLNNALSITSDVLIGYGVVSVTVSNLMLHGFTLLLGAAAVFLMRRIILKEPEMFRFADSDSGLMFREKMKAVVYAPPMLAFGIVMLLYAILVLLRPILGF